jgi:hypothetical protein
VIQGDATVEDDKLTLVVPILGLYAELIACDLADDETAQQQQQQQGSHTPNNANTPATASPLGRFRTGGVHGLVQAARAQSADAAIAASAMNSSSSPPPSPPAQERPPAVPTATAASSSTETIKGIVKEVSQTSPPLHPSSHPISSHLIPSHPIPSHLS